MDKLKIELSNQYDIERFILINIIGLLFSLENKLLTVDECENYLFNPHSFERLKKLNVSDNIIELIELGCEIEDIESLLPNNLEKEIKNIKSKAEKYLSHLYGKDTLYPVWIK